MHPKGNILILVIFVLLATSLMGLLARSFLKDFINYNSQLAHHQKANNLSKAGIEIGLAMVKNRAIGFEYSINSGDHIVKENLNFCKTDCSFKIKISAQAPVLVKDLWGSGEECKGNEITLNKGISLVIPLFKDKVITENKAIDGFDKKPNLSINELDSEILETKGALLQAKVTLEKDGFKSKEISEPNNKIIKTKGEFNTYYIIANISGEPQKICIKSLKGSIPQEQILIESRGKYKDKVLGKRAILVKGIPDFLKSDVYLSAAQP